MKKLIVFTGAGVSAESGLSTFRDSDGLWERHRIEDVCTADAWRRNPALVLDFYNARRKQMCAASPNAAHLAIAAAEKDFDVTVVTQNVDNLHERAGSSRVVHLHGELTKCRSSVDENLIYDLEGWEMKMGQLCAKGSQLRPHIVFFGENVPMYDAALQIVSGADVLLIVGTSLQVYPAAGLVHYAPRTARVFVVDPKVEKVSIGNEVQYFSQPAACGVPLALDAIRKMCW